MLFPTPPPPPDSDVDRWWVYFMCIVIWFRHANSMLGSLVG